jgi:hypothetical protein
MEMRTGLDVHREVIRASLGELGDKGVGIGDHEVDVKREFRDFSERCYDRWANGQVRDEVSVHDIDVQKVGPCTLYGCHLLGQSGKVSRQD